MLVNFSNFYLKEVKKPAKDLVKNPFEGFTKNKNEIAKYLKDWYMTAGYTINDDGVVDIHGDFDIPGSIFGRETLPFQLGTVDGGVIISNNNLTSLIGCPHTVRGSFVCSGNKLTSLDYAPSTIEGRFVASNNLALKSISGIKNLQGLTGLLALQNTSITSIDDVPDTCVKLNVFKCHKLKSFHNIHLTLPNLKLLHFDADLIKSNVLGLLLLKKLEQVFSGISSSLDNNNELWLGIVKPYLARTISHSDIIDCQHQLIDAGLVEYAQL